MEYQVPNAGKGESLSKVPTSWKNPCSIWKDTEGFLNDMDILERNTFDERAKMRKA